MSNPRKTLERVLRGDADANIAFQDMRRLLKTLGFDERIRGSHHVHTREGIEEILNLQPKRANCKPYQVKQVRQVILKYKLAGDVNA
jgi:predicted RNA binding protein YcfA (HicA-like mRNA interferase family)